MIPLKSGALAEVLEPVRRLLRLRLAAAPTSSLDARRGGRALLEALERLRVAGHLRLEPRVEPEGHQDRDRDDHARRARAGRRRRAP